MPKPLDPASLLPEFAREHATSERESAELSELFAELGALGESDSAVLGRGRARLLATVCESGERFRPLFGQLRPFFDLSDDGLRAVFERTGDEHNWHAAPLPGVSLFHLEGGPAVAQLDAGLVRLTRGMPFPRHRHPGSERVLVLEGGYHDHEGRWYGPGALHEMAPGTEHSLQINGDQDTLLAVLLAAQIEIVVR